MIPSPPPFTDNTFPCLHVMPTLGSIHYKRSILVVVHSRFARNTHADKRMRGDSAIGGIVYSNTHANNTTNIKHTWSIETILYTHKHAPKRRHTTPHLVLQSKTTNMAMHIYIYIYIYMYMINIVVP